MQIIRTTARAKGWYFGTRVESLRYALQVDMYSYYYESYLRRSLRFTNYNVCSEYDNAVVFKILDYCL